MDDTLLIVGASARAAAMSARRSGFLIWGADRFDDLDLRTCGPTCRVNDYPAGLETMLVAGDGRRETPWMFTGALENYPALVDRLAAIRPLYGVAGDALRRVRDPFQLSAVLRAAGLAAPRCAASSDGLPRDGSWLAKPLASAGGSGVRPLNADVADDAGGYFQQRIDGESVGALYIGAGGDSRLLGVTRQLIELDWCGLDGQPRDRFRYCGSVGPLRLPPALRDRFELLGKTLVRDFGLRGLFGVDAILAAGDVWPVELNPRYTASVEILERAGNLRSIELHVAAFRENKAPTADTSGGDDLRRCSGKAILFARSDRVIGEDFGDWVERKNRDRAWPAIADIPAHGTTIRAGEPICTVLADGPDEPPVLRALQRLAAEARP